MPLPQRNAWEHVSCKEDRNQKWNLLQGFRVLGTGILNQDETCACMYRNIIMYMYVHLLARQYTHIHTCT